MDTSFKLPYYKTQTENQQGSWDNRNTNIHNIMLTE